MVQNVPRTRSHVVCRVFFVTGSLPALDNSSTTRAKCLGNKFVRGTSAAPQGGRRCGDRGSMKRVSLGEIWRFDTVSCGPTRRPLRRPTLGRWGVLYALALPPPASGGVGPGRERFRRLGAVDGPHKQTRIASAGIDAFPQLPTDLNLIYE